MILDEGTRIMRLSYRLFVNIAASDLKHLLFNLHEKFLFS